MKSGEWRVGDKVRREWRMLDPVPWHVSRQTDRVLVYEMLYENNAVSMFVRCEVGWEGVGWIKCYLIKSDTLKTVEHCSYILDGSDGDNIIRNAGVPMSCSIPLQTIFWVNPHPLGCL